MPASIVVALRNWSPEALFLLIVVAFLCFFWEDYMERHDNFIARTMFWISHHPFLVILILSFVITAIFIIISRF